MIDRHHRNAHKTRSWACDVFGVSAHNVDFIHLVDSIDADETAAEKVGPFSGGSAANTLYALSKFGCRTAVTGIVAGDSAGDCLINDLIAARVNCDPMIVVPPDQSAVTGYTHIYSDEQGGRRIFVAAGLNERFADYLQVNPDAMQLILMRSST